MTKPVPPPPTTPVTPVTPPASGKPPLNLAMADMWDRIAWCESGQRWHLNLGSGYYGGLQFNMDAWRIAAGYDFAPRPDLASREEQITAANRLYADARTQALDLPHGGLTAADPAPPGSDVLGPAVAHTVDA